MESNVCGRNGMFAQGNMQFNWRKDINNDLAAWDKVDFDPAQWADHFVRVLK